MNEMKKIAIGIAAMVGMISGIGVLCKILTGEGVDLYLQLMLFLSLSVILCMVADN